MPKKEESSGKCLKYSMEGFFFFLNSIFYLHKENYLVVSFFCLHLLKFPESQVKILSGKIS